jgi:hypothetical protein
MNMAIWAISFAGAAAALRDAQSARAAALWIAMLVFTAIGFYLNW